MVGQAIVVPWPANCYRLAGHLSLRWKPESTASCRHLLLGSRIRSGPAVTSAVFHEVSQAKRPSNTLEDHLRENYPSRRELPRGLFTAPTASLLTYGGDTDRLAHAAVFHGVLRAKQPSATLENHPGWPAKRVRSGRLLSLSLPAPGNKNRVEKHSHIASLWGYPNRSLTVAALIGAGRQGGFS